MHCYDYYSCTSIFIVSNVKKRREKGEYMDFRVRDFWEEEDGIGVVELILILVVLIGLVILFKDSIRKLVKDIFETITSSAGDVSKTE